MKCIRPDCKRVINVLDKPYCSSICNIDHLESQLAEERKSLGESINYRVFNLTADEAVIALRRAEQLKDQGHE